MELYIALMDRPDTMHDRSKTTEKQISSFVLIEEDAKKLIVSD